MLASNFTVTGLYYFYKKVIEIAKQVSYQKEMVIPFSKLSCTFV